MIMNLTGEPIPIPDHVPENLIEKDFPVVAGNFSNDNPFDRIIPQACEGPDVIFVPDMVPGGGHAWVMRRFEDMRAVYNDTEHFRNRGFTSFSQLIGEDWYLVPAEQDPPDHTYYRTMLNPIFAPGSVAKMEETVRDAAKACVATFKDKSGCEFIDEFASPYPVGVVLDLLDLPKERMKNFLEWEHMILHSGEFESMQAGVRHVSTYLREVIAERKDNLGDDLISHAIRAEINGRKMNDDELLGYATNFFLGGLDTVTANLGNHVRHLATNLEHQRQLRENPKLIRGAIEELMRAFAAVSTYRVCAKETSIRGVTIKPGDKIAMITTLAGRDSREFDQPHEVRLDRNPSHVSFATGPHHCLGVHLARRELRIALEELFSAIPEFRVAEDANISSLVGGITQPKTLPLVW
jgi:cytochrome P450